MLRRCLSCGRIYPSTHPSDRCCPPCARLLVSSRARAAITVKNREILDYIDDLFDINIATKAQLAREFDRRKRAKVNYGILCKQGLEHTAEAQAFHKLARLPNTIFDKKGPDYEDDRPRRDINPEPGIAAIDVVGDVVGDAV